MKLTLFRIVLLSFAAILVCTLGGTARGAVILAPGSTWEYTFTDPTGDATWNTTTGGWTTGAAPFSNAGSGDFAFNTPWPADGTGTLNDDLWVRTTIDLTGYDLSTIAWDLGVDNGFALYANGILVGSANEEGFTFRWEYSGNFAAALNPGVNVLAVALEDHGGATAFDMQVTGDRASSVPDTGSSLTLLGIGLCAMRFAAKRLKRS
jgi:hypothetical protein